jgi:capsular polysaccharide biosynthesis protein
MTRAARFLIHLYPAAWRERYGGELQALLEDRPPKLSGLFDIMKGAAKMHLSLPAFPKLALLLSVTGLLAGWGISFLVPPTYISVSTMLLPQEPGPSPSRFHPDLAALQQQILSRASLSTIILDPSLDLYPSERSRQPLEDAIDTMRDRDLRIAIAGTDVLTISFSYNDPVKAHDTVQIIIAKFQEAFKYQQSVPVYVKRHRTYDQIDKLESRIAALEKRLGVPPATPEPLDDLVPATEEIGLEVLDPPTTPENPAKPNRYIFACFGFGGGFIAALIVAIFRRPAWPALPFPAQPA